MAEAWLEDEEEELRDGAANRRHHRRANLNPATGTHPLTRQYQPAAWRALRPGHSGAGLAVPGTGMLAASLRPVRSFLTMALPLLAWLVC